MYSELWTEIDGMNIRDQASAAKSLTQDLVVRVMVLTAVLERVEAANDTGLLNDVEKQQLIDTRDCLVEFRNLFDRLTAKGR